MRLNTKQICEYTGGRLIVEPIDASELSSGICWDSRKVSADDTYVALPGERVDGHAFIEDALKAGARVILVQDPPSNEACLLAREMGAAVVEVSNTAAAITDLARMWRKTLTAKVVALTGSSGKTTTKNLIRDVLKSKYSVAATQGNQNNELGVPNTLLSANPETQVVIVEMGMRGKGQISELCSFVRPDVGLITNIGEGHIELLGSKQAIAEAKAELFACLTDGSGIACMNYSDDFARFVCDQADLSSRHVELVWYDGSGKSHGEQIGDAEKTGAKPLPDEEGYANRERWGAWAEEIHLDEKGCPHFLLFIGSECRECFVPLQGAHNVHNAVAAASVGSVFNIGIDAIVQALKNAEPEGGRQEIITTKENLTIINDSYNANPDSMRAALLMFSSYEVSGRRIAVLGDMGELGDYSQACHEGIGELVAELPIDRLICVGELSKHIAHAAQNAGFNSDKICSVMSIPEVLVELDSYLRPEDAVLVKASRFMGLERVVGGIVN